jgi:hypothetical protein
MVFAGWASKPVVTVSIGLALKPAVTVSSGLASKLAATVSSGLTWKPAVTVFSSLVSKLAAMVSPDLASKYAVGFLVDPQNQCGGGFSGLCLNRQLRFGDLGIKITATASWFVPQNQVGFGLSVAPHNW